MAEILFRQWFIEEADDGWEEKPLGEIATIQNGYSFSSRDYVEQQIDHLEVFKMGHIKPGGGLRYSPKSDFVPREQKLIKWILSEDDIVMAMTDMKDSMGILGHPAMIDESDTYVLNQRVARIYLDSNEILINNYFLYLQLKTDTAITIIQSKAHGGVQVNLSTEAIRSTPIIIPPKSEQEKGFSVLGGYLFKLKNNRKQICTLEKLRDTVLPKLMTGKLRISCEGGV
jgi:type I restriction enzyme, S subunit